MVNPPFKIMKPPIIRTTVFIKADRNTGMAERLDMAGKGLLDSRYLPADC